MFGESGGRCGGRLVEWSAAAISLRLRQSGTYLVGVGLLWVGHPGTPNT